MEVVGDKWGLWGRYGAFSMSGGFMVVVWWE